MTTSTPSFTPAGMFREVARLHVRAQRVTVATHGGGSTRCTILTELGRASSLSLAELSARLKLDKGWVSRTIDQLVDDGTVLRATDANDRRAVVLTLTVKGRKEHRDLERLLDNQIEGVFARLRVSDRAKVASAISLLHEAYVAELSALDRAGNSADETTAPSARPERRRVAR